VGQGYFALFPGRQTPPHGGSRALGQHLRNPALNHPKLRSPHSQIRSLSDSITTTLADIFE
jgi:hypothetical protein